MANNKVVLADGTVLMDTTGVTVDSAHLVSGYTALDHTGTLITGTAVADNTFFITLSNVNDVWTPDCTFTEAQTAYNGGKNLIFQTDDTDTATVPLWRYDDLDGFYYTVEVPFYENPSTGLYQWGVDYLTYQWHLVGGSIILHETYRYYSTESGNASAADVRTGKKFYNADGIQTGTMPNGTAGTPTATKGTVSNHSVTITPSVTNTTGYITGGTKTGTAVTVTAAELESGTKTITENGTGISVSGYSTVDVNVESAPSITVSPLTVTQNGTYTAPSGTAYTPVIVDVSGGGGATAEEKDVNFIDYDGTILYSYTPAEFAQLSALPANPGHAGLTAQGWNWSLSDAKTYVAKYGKLNIGQMYITTSGATEIDITLTAPNLHPYLQIAPKGTVVIDWGDNTATDTVTGASNRSLKFIDHEYASAGNYTIKLTVSSGNFAFYTNSSSYRGVLSVKSDVTRSSLYANDITAIRIGENAQIGANAFVYCSSLKSITIPDSVTSIETYAFQSCYALSSITIPSGVTSIETYAFQYCYALTSITIPSGVTSIGNYAFQSCSALTSITIPSSVTNIGTNVFQSCYVLSSITIPSGVTNVGGSAFQSCYALSSITIPSGVTSIKINVFQSCSALISITIPSGITNIGTNAFSSCSEVQEFHFLPTTPPTLGGTNAFYATPSTCVFYVPAASLEAYQTATNWSTYASRMVGE